MGSKQTAGTTAAGRQLVVQDHELLRSIGRGAYGEVWLARNVMGTYRAVKLVFRREFSDARCYDRELEGVRSFEPVSRSHEGFVDILQIGVDPAGEHFYYVMELADDVAGGRTIVPETYRPRTLKEDLEQGSIQPAAACVELGLALSGALGQLHASELVHRDIKPANIVFIEGRPKLADIGLVAPLDPDGSFVGTEGFVPPEGPNAFAADLYALGKVLYEMSTGKDRKAFPELPIEWAESPDQRLLHELNEVTIRACEHDASARYQSAKDMHADLAALGAGKSVRWQRTLERRLVRLKRAALASALVLLLLGGFYVEYERGRVERANLRQRQVGLRLAEGNTRAEAGDLLGALPHFAAALRLEEGDARARSLHELRLESALAQSPKIARLWTFTNEIRDLVYSPGAGRLLAVLGSGELVGLDSDREEPLFRTDQTDPFVDRVAFNSDGTAFLASSHSGVLRWFRAEDGSLLGQVKLGCDLSMAQFSPDNRLIACAARNGKVLLVDGHDGHLLQEIAAHAAALWSVAWSPDGQYLVTTSEDETALIWEVPGDTRAAGPLRHRDWVYYSCLTPDGRRLVTAGFDRHARLWEFPSGRPLGVPMPHTDGVVRAVFSPDGQMIATASLDGTVGLWDGFTAVPLPRHPRLVHTSRLASLAFSPDGRRLGTACVDGTIRVWDLAGVRPVKLASCGAATEDGRSLLTFEGGQGRVRSLPTLDFAPATAGLETGPSVVLTRGGGWGLLGTPIESTNAQVLAWRAWRFPEEASAGPIIATSGPLTRLSEDGRSVALVTSNLVRWEALAPNSAPRGLARLSQPVEGLAWSPDSRSLVAWGGNEACLAKRDPRLGPPLLLHHTMTVVHACFSPDGKWVATGERDRFLAPGSLRLWEASTGRAVGPIRQHRDGVLWVAFSPDGQKLVSAGEDFTAKIWSPLSPDPLVPPLMHANQVDEATFSPDGRRVITVCADRSVRIWDAASGLPLTPPLLHFEPVDHAVLTADGTQIISWRDRGSVWCWPLLRATPSLEDWDDFSRVLCAAPPSPLGEGAFPSVPRATPLQMTWHGLRTKYPQAFESAAHEVSDWHRQMAVDAEQNRRWGEALFHLNHLLLLQPTNAMLLHWRDRLRERQHSP